MVPAVNRNVSGSASARSGALCPPCSDISKRPKSADLKNLNKSKGPPIEQHVKKHVIKNWNEVALFLD